MDLVKKISVKISTVIITVAVIGLVPVSWTLTLLQCHGGTNTPKWLISLAKGENCQQINIKFVMVLVDVTDETLYTFSFSGMNAKICSHVTNMDCLIFEASEYLL